MRIPRHLVPAPQIWCQVTSVPLSPDQIRRPDWAARVEKDDEACVVELRTTVELGGVQLPAGTQVLEVVGWDYVQADLP